jgi:hypothetical protein
MLIQKDVILRVVKIIGTTCVRLTGMQSRDLELMTSGHDVSLLCLFFAIFYANLQFLNMIFRGGKHYQPPLEINF